MRRPSAPVIAAVLCLAAGAALAMGEADRLDVVLLAIGAPPGAEETSAVERLAWELEKRTSIVAAPRPLVLAPGDPQLRRHPLLVLHGRGPLPPLDERSLDALRGHLEAGGLLFIDAADADRPLDEEDPFDRDVRTLVRRLFARAPLAPVPAEHVLYRTFYRLPAPAGRRVRARSLEAVALDGRLAVVYSRNDVLGALARDRVGAFAHAVEPGGEPQRELALRTAMNLVLYALCLDYKADQVHVPFLLQRGTPR